jgi:predicted transcriptional regulator
LAGWKSGTYRIAFIVQPSRETWLKKRSSLDIISTILEAANGGIGKTRLLEKANLTTSQFRKYSRLLVSKELLIEKIEGSHQAYKTTELGIQYVALYGAIKSTLYLNSMAEF